MKDSQNFVVDTARDATPSIAGYVYQIYQSVYAWVVLQENELLVLEGAEDFDVFQKKSVITTQVKNTEGNITLRSADVIEALNNYWFTKEKNPGFAVIFRFLTTSEAGQENGAPFGPGMKGLDFWKTCTTKTTEIEVLREFLATLRLSTELVKFIIDAPAEILREQLIRPIKWDLGNKDRMTLESILEAKLTIHGFKLGINSHLSMQALPHLLKKVADLLSTKGRKVLTLSDFINSFDDATTVPVPRGKLEAMAGTSPLQKLAGIVDSAAMLRLLRFSSPVIGNPLPLVDGGIPRPTVTSNLAKLLSEQSIIFLSGSSGLGKTNLAALIAQHFGGGWGWIGFRGIPAEQVKDLLLRATFEMDTASLPPLLVLDDLDFSQLSVFEREFTVLVFSIINASGMVIITGPCRPPLQLFPKIWKDEVSEATVPYFDEEEVAEMIARHGLDDEKRKTEWAKTICLTTSGHPQLVHARVRNASSRGWPPVEISDFTKPEDVERVRAEARQRLVTEFPNDNTRTLAYRLSLANGAFSRETAIAVAETPPPLGLPGETFDALVGPWVEREGENKYRVSPLLTGAGYNVLTGSNIKDVHAAIAGSVLRHKTINQFEVSTAFFHAFMARHPELLNKLAYTVIMTEDPKLAILYDAMSWVTFIALDPGQKIFDDNPAVDYMLRLAQYKLIVSSHKPDKLSNIIERIEETLQLLQPPEFRQLSEGLAYGIILNTLAELPSSVVVRLLSRMIDIQEESSVFDEISKTLSSGDIALPILGENKPSQVLFAIQAVRIAGLDDLSDLIVSLDALPANKREHLLKICDSEVDFASLLISRAWWKESERGTLDVAKALDTYNRMVERSRAWEVPKLTKASLIAISVLLDEYDNSFERALQVIDSTDMEFPHDAGLSNQRAKVLFHAGRDEEGLPFAYQALELPGLSNVEFVFCCRAAGIAAANLNDWSECERLFLLGSEKAKQVDVQQGMRIGLIADVAVALWRQEKYRESLLLFADVLDLLKHIPLSGDIRVRHLHATVRHCISWIHFQALGTNPVDFADPRPGMCSNQEPNEGIKDHRIIDISAAWELLSVTEKILGLDLGITARTQAVAGGKIPLLVAGYSRILTLNMIFENLNFEKLISAVVEMFEAVEYSTVSTESADDEYAVMDIPKLPDAYWNDPTKHGVILHCLLAACIVSTFSNQSKPWPTQTWRSDLQKYGALTGEVNQFLNVLDGADPDQTIYQQSASAAVKLRGGTLTPKELWRCSFRLLNVFMNEQRWGVPAFEGLIIPRWVYAVNAQRFAFSTPSLACPRIEKICRDGSSTGIAKIAAILEAAAAYLHISLSLEVKEALRSLIK